MIKKKIIKEHIRKIILAFFLVSILLNTKPIYLMYKLKFLINPKIDIIYYDNANCNYALRVNDKQYEKLISKMKNSGYHSFFKDEMYYIYLENEGTWLPKDKITDAYYLDTVEYTFFPAGKRIHIQSYITCSEDGYREIYFTRN